jgi:dolichyl-phosphate-mannose--protein O-mannosyl transferase
MTNVIVILIAAALWVFQELLIVTYGNTNLNAEQVEKLTWMESWDFLLHK